jgi:thiosulfate/3-mercaptopyruvate sulfurtransferase
MNSKKIIGFIIASLLFISQIFGQDIISAKDFVALKKEKTIVLIDASKDKLYAQKHIGDAINIPYATLNEKDGTVEGLMLPVEEVAKILGSKGVSNEDTIVVYDEGSQKYSTRVYWILKYLGAKDVKLLHYETNAFRSAKIAMTATVPSVKAKTFTVNLNPEIFADAAFVESAIGNPEVVIIDARTPDEFKGEINDKNTYSKGHIEGAINIPYESMVNAETNIFITPEEFKTLAGIELSPDKTYLVYCKTGVKGSTLYAYMVNVLGLTKVKNYEGAYAEWDVLGKPSVK